MLIVIDETDIDNNNNNKNKKYDAATGPQVLDVLNMFLQFHVHFSDAQLPINKTNFSSTALHQFSHVNL